MALLDKLRRLIVGKSIWEQLEEVFDEDVIKDLKRAMFLKKFADKTGLPVIINVPQLRIQYTYDPLDHKIKEEKIKLMKLLAKREYEKLRESELRKLIRQFE